MKSETVPVLPPLLRGAMVREEYCKNVKGDVADDSAQHCREGKMLNVFRDVSHHRNESNCVCTNAVSMIQTSGGGVIPRRRIDPSNAIPSNGAFCVRTDRP